MSPFGQAGARSGEGCGATGRGGARRPIAPWGGRAAEAAGGYRNAQCVQLRSARLAEPRHHMSRGAGSCHSAPVCAPKLQLRVPPPTLTMSICCCFFFRDYGSSKRKSGKRISASVFLTFQLHAPVPLILRRTFAGGGREGDAFLACGTIVLPASGWGCTSVAPSLSLALQVLCHAHLHSPP